MKLDNYRAKVMQRELERLDFQALPEQLAHQLDTLIQQVNASADSPQAEADYEQAFDKAVAGRIQSQAESQSQLTVINHAMDLERGFEELTSITLPRAQRAIDAGVSMDKVNSDINLAVGKLYNDIPRYNQYLGALGIGFANLDSVTNFYNFANSETFKFNDQTEAFDKLFLKPSIQGLQITDTEKFMSFLRNLREQGTTLNPDAQSDLSFLISNTVQGQLMQGAKQKLEEREAMGMSLADPNDDLLDSLKDIYEAASDIGIDLTEEAHGFPLLEAYENDYLAEYAAMSEIGLLSNDGPNSIRRNTESLFRNNDYLDLFENSFKGKQEILSLIANGENTEAKASLEAVLSNQYDQVNLAVMALNTKYTGENKADAVKIAKAYKEHVQNLRYALGFIN